MASVFGFQRQRTEQKRQQAVAFVFCETLNGGREALVDEETILPTGIPRAQPPSLMESVIRRAASLTSAPRLMQSCSGMRSDGADTVMAATG